MPSHKRLLIEIAFPSRRFLFPACLPILQNRNYNHVETVVVANVVVVTVVVVTVVVVTV